MCIRDRCMEQLGCEGIHGPGQGRARAHCDAWCKGGLPRKGAVAWARNICMAIHMFHGPERWPCGGSLRANPGPGRMRGDRGTRDAQYDPAEVCMAIHMFPLSNWRFMRLNCLVPCPARSAAHGPEPSPRSKTRIYVWPYICSKVRKGDFAEADMCKPASSATHGRSALCRSPSRPS